MSYIESKVFKTTKKSNIYLVWNKKGRNYKSQINPFLKFTHEPMVNNKNPFLDVDIKLKSKVFTSIKNTPVRTLVFKTKISLDKEYF